MVQPLEQKKRQKILIGILIVVIIITIFVWYSNFQKGPSVVKEQAAISPLVSEKRLKDIELELNVLDSSLFKSLKSHGVLPITVGETGRQNPFEPY